jgi:hypothetical protein
VIPGRARAAGTGLVAVAAPCAALLAGAALCAAGLAGVDRASSRARLSADGRFDHSFYEGYNAYREHNASRVAFRRSRLVLPGLRAGARVELELRVQPRRRPFELRLIANGETAALRELQPGWHRVRFEATADAAGALRIGFDGGHLRLSGVELRVLEPGATPPGRWLAYFGLAGLAMLVGLYWSRRPAVTAVAALALCGLFSLGLLEARLHALALLPRVLLVLLAVPPLGLLLQRAVGLPARAAPFVAAALALKLALVTHPAFPSIDAAFHAHNLESFREGELITSRAPGASQDSKVDVPYPPALYALLAPFAARDPAPGKARFDTWVDLELLVRCAQALLVGSAPILIFLIGRRGGLEPEAAGAAAAIAALTPESLLVLAKGITANSLGHTATLLLVLAGIAAAPAWLLFPAALLAVASHLGGAATALLLVGAWLARETWLGRLERARLLRWLAALAAAGLVAWLAYYRHALGRTAADLGGLAGVAVSAPVAFFGVRWYRLGKAAQNLLLKFGGVPLLLAAVGAARGLPPRLAAWLVPWAAAGAATGLIALLTPVPLRFEYFLVPAVALAAGSGAAALRESGHTRLLGAALGLLAALHLALAGLLLAGRVELISVIMESPRWPWPAPSSGST